MEYLPKNRPISKNQLPPHPLLRVNEEEVDIKSVSTQYLIGGNEQGATTAAPNTTLTNRNATFTNRNATFTNRNATSRHACAQIAFGLCLLALFANFVGMVESLLTSNGARDTDHTISLIPCAADGTAADGTSEGILIEGSLECKPEYSFIFSITSTVIMVIELIFLGYNCLGARPR